MSCRRFITFSVLASGIIGAGVWFVWGFAFPDTPREGLAWGMPLAFGASTAGWSVLVRGLRDDPVKIAGWFLVAMMVKVVFAVVGVTVATLLGGVPLEGVLLPFAVLFVLFGLVQLAVVVGTARRQLKQDKGADGS